MSILFLFLFREKKRYLVHLSFVYLSLILSMNQVERLCFGVPRSPWIVSANEMNAEPVPNAFLIWKLSSREKNKMLLSLPLSFLALLIFPSNAGRAAAGAGGRNLREECFLLGPSFFSATQERKTFCHPCSFPDFVFFAWRS